MSTEAGTIVIVMDVNDARLYKKFKKAEQTVKKSGRKMSNSMTRSMARISTAAKGMAVGMALAFGRQLLGSIVEAGLAMDRFGRTFKVATGSAGLAAREMEWVDTIANRLGIDLLTAAGAYAKLTAAAKGTALEGQGVRDIFEALSGATMVLGLSAQDTGQILTAVEQMMSKGKVAAEEVRRQMQKLPGAFQMAARAMGMTTAELDKQLKLGTVVAEDMLPGLARELNNTFGPSLDEATNMAQASFARFDNAVLRIKANIAESGVMKALADLAQGIANVFNPELQLDLSKTMDRIAQLKTRIAELRAIDPFSKAGERAGNELFNLLPQLDEAEARLIELNKKIGRLHEGAVNKKSSDADKLPAGFDAFVKANETVEDEIQRLKAELEIMKPYIEETYPGMYETAYAKIAALQSKASRAIINQYGGDVEKAALKAADALMAASQNFEGAELDALVARIYEEFEKVAELKEIIPLTNFKKTAKEMSEVAKEAARNIQDAFADFLFDPFDAGLKGMLESFLTTIRRMLANKFAASFLGAPIFKGFFDGARAEGGPVSGGGTYLVGERGPEIFTPTRSGSIIPNHKMGGGVTNIYNFQAGADVATIRSEIIPLLEMTKQSTIATIHQQRSQGIL